MRFFLHLLRILLKAAIFCVAAVVVLMLCRVALEVAVPVVILLGILFVLRGVWRVLTPRRRVVSDQ